MKLRINFLQREVYYIPDVMVACDPAPRDRRFREEPLLLIEVLSESTKATDERETVFAYTAISHLKHYVLVDQDRMLVTHFRRGDTGWTDETLTSAGQVLVVPELDFRMSVRGDLRGSRIRGRRGLMVNRLRSSPALR